MLLNRKHSLSVVKPNIIEQKNTPEPKESTGKTETFLQKLYIILQKKQYTSLIHWNPKGSAIIISNITEFTKKVLPKYFKHHNYASFVRQLNMYNFHKIRIHGLSTTEQIYQHDIFRRDKTFQEISLIKRKLKFDVDEDILVNDVSRIDNTWESQSVSAGWTCSTNSNSIKQKEDQAQVERYSQILMNHNVNKNTIEHILWFLLKKTKQNIETQTILENKVDQLTKQNEELRQEIANISNKEMRNKNIFYSKIREVTLFILTWIMKKKIQKLPKEQFPSNSGKTKIRDLVCKYWNHYNKTNTIVNPSQSPTFGLIKVQNKIEANEAFCISRSIQTRMEGTQFDSVFDNTSSGNYDDIFSLRSIPSRNWFDIDLNIENTSF